MTVFKNYFFLTSRSEIWIHRGVSPTLQSHMLGMWPLDAPPRAPRLHSFPLPTATTALSQAGPVLPPTGKNCALFNPFYLLVLPRGCSSLRQSRFARASLLWTITSLAPVSSCIWDAHSTCLMPASLHFQLNSSFQCGTAPAFSCWICIILLQIIIHKLNFLYFSLYYNEHIKY